MRESKYRGKLDLSTEELKELEIPHKNGWVIGKLIGDEKRPVIVGPIGDLNDEYFNTEWWCSVIPESVGQFTGLKDMDREEIFEGAIGWDERGEVHGKIVFDEGGFLFEWENMQDDLFECCGDIVIVGNIHDNPELLEVAK